MEVIRGATKRKRPALQSTALEQDKENLASAELSTSDEALLDEALEADPEPNFETTEDVVKRARMMSPPPIFYDGETTINLVARMMKGEELTIDLKPRKPPVPTEAFTIYQDLELSDENKTEEEEGEAMEVPFQSSTSASIPIYVDPEYIDESASDSRPSDNNTFSLQNFGNTSRTTSGGFHGLNSKPFSVEEPLGSTASSSSFAIYEDPDISETTQPNGSEGESSEGTILDQQRPQLLSQIDNKRRTSIVPQGIPIPIFEDPETLPQQQQQQQQQRTLSLPRAEFKNKRSSIDTIPKRKSYDNTRAMISPRLSLTPSTLLNEGVESHQEKIQTLETNLEQEREYVAEEKKKSQNLQLRVEELETLLKQSKTKQEELQIELEKEKNQARSAVLTESKKAEVLRVQVKFFSDRDAIREAELGEKQEQLLKIQQTHAQEVQALTKKRSEAEDQLANLRENYRSRESNHTHQIELLQTREKSNKKEILTLKTENERMREQLKSQIQDLQDYEQAKAWMDKTRAQMQEYERRSSEWLKSESIIKSLRESLRNYSELEKQNRAAQDEIRLLRNEVQNTALLQEKIRVLSDKIARNVQAVEAAAKLEADYKVLNEKYQYWTKTVSSFWPSVQTPEQLLIKIRDVHTEQVGRLEKEGSLHTEIKQSSNNMQDLKDKLVKLEAEKVTTELALKKAELLLQRNERKLSHALKERELFRGLLDSYDKEEALSTNHEDHRIKRIEELEETRSRQLKELEETQKELEQAKKEAQREIDRLSMENKKLEKYLRQAELEVAKLSEKSVLGEYDPTKTKIVHFKHNPQSTAGKQAREAALKKLQAEIAQLKEHIQGLEKAAAATATATPAASSAPERSNLSELKELHQLKQKLDASQEIERKLMKKVEGEEKKTKRLTQVFQSQVMAFRKTVYELLGYKVELMQENRWRLKSRYAEKEEDCLMFESGTGTMRMLETEFTKLLDVGTLELLNVGHSIPAFLSNITLQGFAKETRTINRTPIAVVTT